MVKQIKLYSQIWGNFKTPGWEKDFEIGKSWFKKEEYDQAILFFTSSLISNPRHIKSLFFRGLSNIYKNKKKYILYAVEDFTKIIKIYPSNQSYVNRSAAYIYLKEYEKSIEDCNKVIKVDPKNKKAYFNRAISNTFLSRYDEAKKDIEQDIKLNKYKEYFSYLIKGIIERRTGEYKDSIKSFKKVLSYKVVEDEDIIFSYKQCIFNEIALGRYFNAIEYAKIGLQKFAVYSYARDYYMKDSEAWIIYIIYSYTNLEYFNEAYSWCNKLLLKCTKEIELIILIFRGYIESKFGKYERSLEDLSKAFKINESDFKNRYFKIYGLNIENLIYDLPKEMKNILIISENISLN